MAGDWDRDRAGPAAAGALSEPEVLPLCSDRVELMTATRHRPVAVAPPPPTTATKGGRDTAGRKVSPLGPRPASPVGGGEGSVDDTCQAGGVFFLQGGFELRL